MPVIVTPQPIMPIAMVALDIDGTLVGDDLVIGPATRQAIRAARDRGIVVTLITGRMVSSALRFARELDLIAPIVGYQGALIREMPDVIVHATGPAARPHAAGRVGRPRGRRLGARAGPRPARQPPGALHHPLG